MVGKTIDQLLVGDTAQFSKTVSETDVYLFAGISGDIYKLWETPKKLCTSHCQSKF